MKKPRLFAQAGLFHGPGLDEGFRLVFFLGFMLRFNYWLLSCRLFGLFLGCR